MHSDDLTTYYPGIQADYNQYILADPKNRQHVYLRLEEVFESDQRRARSGTPSGRTGTSTSAATRTDDTPYDCPRTTHPDQHAGFLYDGQFWEGNDGGVWNRPVTQHTRGHWTNLNPGLDTLQYYSAAVGDARQRPRLLGRHAGQRRDVLGDRHAQRRAGVHR